MKRVLSVLFLVGLASLIGCGGGGGNGGEESGGPCDQINARVMGGDQCLVQGNPVVPLVVHDSNGNILSICSGALITVQHILTAGHCVTDPPQHFSDAAGMVTIVGGVVHRITNGAVHPDFDRRVTRSMFAHDLAILVMDAPGNVAPVPILGSRQVAVGDEVTIYGFGLNDDAQTMDALLRRGADLRAAYLTVEAASLQGFGGGFSNGTGICPGDSGGPAIETFNGYSAIVGVNSFGLAGSCSSEDSISGIVAVAELSNLAFIKANAPSVIVR